MFRRVVGTALCLGVAWSASSAAGPSTPDKMRGVCWEGAGAIDATDLAPLKELGADWISQTPFGWAGSETGTEIRFASDRGMWGETDRGLATTAETARSLGIKTLLAPHVWVRHGGWQGDIAMASEDDWAAWFASYQAFIVHYAQLAEKHGIEALAIGTELAKTSGRTADWKKLIAHVRAVYHGKLTYGANWNGEAEAIGFWDELDFIGIQAYYPLAGTDEPTKKQIETAWQPIVAKLEALAKRVGKPIVFTEVGFKSHTGALKQPWQWEPEGEVDLALQRDAFSATFETLWDRPWFGGTFVWKWHPSPPPALTTNRDFTPQGKPALSVIKAYYTAP